MKNCSENFISQFEFSSGKKKMSMCERDLCSHRNLLADFCFLTSHCLKLFYCIIFAHWLVGLLVFVCKGLAICS